MNFEHFKTCIRAYFPNHDFSWLRDCRMHFHEPFCLSEADIRDVAIHFDLLTPGEPIPDPDPKLPDENRYGYRIYRKGNFHGVGSLVFYSNANGEFAELPARFCPMCGDPLVTD